MLVLVTHDLVAGSGRIAQDGATVCGGIFKPLPIPTRPAADARPARRTSALWKPVWRRTLNKDSWVH